MARPSRIWIRNKWPSPPEPGDLVVYGYSDLDDHLRLIALIADHFENHEVASREAIEACKEPKLSWSERRDAFDRLLRSLRDVDFVGYLVDPDALEPDATPNQSDHDSSGTNEDARIERWDDAEFRRERTRMRDVLFESVNRGGWEILRPLPEQPTTRLLEELDHVVEEPEIDEDADPGSSEFEDMLRILPPVIERLARGLVHIGAKTENSVIRHIRDVPDQLRRRSILELAYDSMTPQVRRAARRLAILRGPQQVNGRIGQFFSFMSEDSLDDRTVPQDAVATLRQMGWLTEEEGQQIRFEAPLRKFLLERARLADAEQVQQDQHEIGESEGASDDLRLLLEIHHHAVMSTNFDRALETAVCFGNDLRQVGVQLSRQGNRREAAKVFKQIVDNFDSEDAYAWEYYAFNLARHADEHDELGRWKDEIYKSYNKACELSSQNPLYWGRFIGFQASLGQDIKDQFDRRMALYQKRSDPVAAGYFAKPVLDALGRSGQDQTQEQLLDAWRTTLKRDSYIRERWLND